MLTLSFGWRNLWRNKLRTGIQLLAIAGGVFLTTFIANLQKGSWEKVIDDGVRAGSGHVAVYHSRYLAERKTEDLFPVGGLLAQLATDTRITALYPRLYVPGLAQSSRESRSALVMGVEIASESRTNPLLSARRLFQGELPLGAKRDMAYVGCKLATALQLKVGNKMVIMLQDRHGKITSKLFRLAGIFQSNIIQMDNNGIFVDRRLLAESMGHGDVAHELSLIAADLDHINDLKRSVAQLPHLPTQASAYSWQEAMPELASAVRMDHIQLLILLSIIYSVVGIGAVNTLLMSVMERTREFGLFRALGLESRHIRTIVLVEAAFLALVGVGLGAIASFGASMYTYMYGINLTSMMGNLEVAGILISPIIYSGWDLPTCLTMCAIMIGLVVVGSLYPARRALKIRPAEAMRKF
jgi:ABC-type lipoprotein release transport system permease subunit